MSKTTEATAIAYAPAQVQTPDDLSAGIFALLPPNPVRTFSSILRHVMHTLCEHDGQAKHRSRRRWTTSAVASGIEKYGAESASTWFAVFLAVPENPRQNPAGILGHMYSASAADASRAIPFSRKYARMRPVTSSYDGDSKRTFPSSQNHLPPGGADAMEANVVISASSPRGSP